MIRTGIDPIVQVRHPVVNSNLELIDQRRALYLANPSQFTRYQLVAAEQRLVTTCRVLGLV